MSDNERDGMAMALCVVETRSRAASLEEVQAGIQRWTRHRHEAERLIEELADAGFEVCQIVESEPSDAQVIAALNAYWEYDPPVTDVGYWSEKHVGIMRAALRAAGGVR